MKKGNVVILTLLAMLAVIAAIGFAFYNKNISSPQYPQITFAEESISVTVDASDAELLQGVTAYDPEDGDVTASLVVEGVSNIAKGDTVKVTYAAFDSRNHVTKAERLVKFVDYKGPRFNMSAPLIFRRANDINLLSCVGAEDPFDGDISGRIKYAIVTNGVSFSDAGEYEIKLNVTNSIGDTAMLPVTVEITTQDYNPAHITLTDYIVYLEVGDEFNPRDYVVGYTVRDTEHEGAYGLRIENNVDTDEAGIYTVDYSYTSSPQSHTRLIVVVE